MLASSCSLIVIELAKQTKDLQFETIPALHSRGFFFPEINLERTVGVKRFFILLNCVLNAFVLCSDRMQWRVYRQERADHLPHSAHSQI